MASLPRHPDTIPGLAPDCRRVLRDAYQSIQVAMSRPEHTVLRDEVLDDGTVVTVQRSEPVPGISVQRAIAEYRRVAAMWGVET